VFQDPDGAREVVLGAPSGADVEARLADLAAG
jgi:hypothetical protein